MIPAGMLALRASAIGDASLAPAASSVAQAGCGRVDPGGGAEDRVTDSIEEALTALHRVPRGLDVQAAGQAAAEAAAYGSVSCIVVLVLAASHHHAQPRAQQQQYTGLSPPPGR
jgi:hypothetical protein